MFNTNIKKGILLLSEPFIEDTNFSLTVIYICEHLKDGTIGLIINKQTKFLIGDAIPELDYFEAPLYYGGPVEPETLHFLHTYGNLIEDSLEVSEGLYWNGNFETLKTLISTNQISPENIRFYIGYTGWEQGQLNREIKEKAWIVIDNTHSHIFSTEPQNLWRQILRDSGNDDLRIKSHFPENPQFN